MEFLCVEAEKPKKMIVFKKYFKSNTNTF